MTGGRAGGARWLARSGRSTSAISCFPTRQTHKHTRADAAVILIAGGNKQSFRSLEQTSANEMKGGRGDKDAALRVRANVPFGDSQSQRNTVSGLTAAEEYVLL